jgi:hypothetical protein
MTGCETKFFMSSVGRRCCAAQIQGRAAALPYRGGEEFCLTPNLTPNPLLFLHPAPESIMLGQDSPQL